MPWRRRFCPVFLFRKKNVLENVKPGRFLPMSGWLKNTINELENALNLNDDECEIIWRNYF